ncbi:hypothetical protein SADUNF_Sadunf04G0058500 [Salix dunnii]|uniref:Uncharacterized protein n=1 Tax=Salix dunnii TaxID=1413687 RepID=A0A835KDC4_9ROSI|nr:hypothetical protein SADUNF_Sadunf04G0058500 [Salix dunnii]
MPSITPFNIFMEKKKPKGGGSTDDLALVKAAAWAWYHHGSGSEGKPIYEFDVTRTRQAPGPSRYRVEAVRIMEEEAMGSRSETPSPVRTDNSLLDEYEVERISKQLEYVLESSSNRFYGFKIDHLDHAQTSMSSLDSDLTLGMKQKKKKDKKKKTILQGFWLRHSVVCGTREDVDTGALERCGSGGDRKVIFR